MKLRKLRIASFAAIRDLEVELGPGLNVLYGPNDLGKSTIVAAIRLALLLPHTSTHSDQYVGWISGENPTVELTFETGAQRIWRVRKTFGKNGASFLQESKNGVEFDDVDRGRGVDAKLREILRWGIPEPGGAGASKGLPTSFLATALLSPQDNVDAVMKESLQSDPSASGKDRIAAALQAVAQDPLFLALLRNAQARRDEAYGDKGNKKTAKGSVFRVAAERVNEARDERDRLHRLVADSEGAEAQLRGHTTARIQALEKLTASMRVAEELKEILTQTAQRTGAHEGVVAAQECVRRVRKVFADVELAEARAEELALRVEEAKAAFEIATSRLAEAEAKLKSEEVTALAAGGDSEAADLAARRDLELTKARAAQSVREAQDTVASALAAQKLIDEAKAAQLLLENQLAQADKAKAASIDAAKKLSGTEDEMRRCDQLDLLVAHQQASTQYAKARVGVDKIGELRNKFDAATALRDQLVSRRSEFTIPDLAVLATMRKLSSELAVARGALAVGLMATVTPERALDVKVRLDGGPEVVQARGEPWIIEATSEVDLTIAKIGRISIRGGRREAQEEVDRLQSEWMRVGQPYLDAVGVTDVESLDAKVLERRDLEAEIKACTGEVDLIRRQLADLSGAQADFDSAATRVQSTHAALAGLPIEALAEILQPFGADPQGGVKRRRDQLSKILDDLRIAANGSSTTEALAKDHVERARNDAAKAGAMRDEASLKFPEGVGAALITAREKLNAGKTEEDRLKSELAALEQTLAARKSSVEAALADARSAVQASKSAADHAQGLHTASIAEQASHNGRLIELRRLRDAEDLAAIEAKEKEAITFHASLPVPLRQVTEQELVEAQAAASRVKLELEGIEKEIHIAQGALQQVGGAVARERLHDATEAFQLAERQEREIESEYEAWKLLLEQMKEADAAQASNLGQALVPAVASRIQELTQRRYQSVQLTAQLGTEGVFAAGAVRPATQLSVGTREQMAVLYRLSLAEYLKTSIVLDDQLVQSDGTRMDWFRTLLAEKARCFQIVVLTCRPMDYLEADALAPQLGAAYLDTNEGYIRAMDLARLVQRR